MEIESNRLISNTTLTLNQIHNKVTLARVYLADKLVRLIDDVFKQSKMYNKLKKFNVG
jgi:hypothetical protein